MRVRVQILSKRCKAMVLLLLPLQQQLAAFCLLLIVKGVILNAAPLPLLLLLLLLLKHPWDVLLLLLHVLKALLPRPCCRPIAAAGCGTPTNAITGWRSRCRRCCCCSCRGVKVGHPLFIHDHALLAGPAACSCSTAARHRLTQQQQPLWTLRLRLRV
jgi:hypothetical protein